MVWSFSFLCCGFGVAFTHRCDQARIVCTQHFYDWIACTQFPHAIGYAEIPSLLVPVNSQRGIAIPVIRNKDVGSYARYCIHKLPYATHATIPVSVQLLLVQLKPGLERGEAANHFFFSNFHGTANCPFAWTAIQQRRLDEIFPPQEQSTALRAAQAFSAGKTVEVEAHLGIELGIFSGRDAGCI